jgi:hypothetical protein
MAQGGLRVGVLMALALTACAAPSSQTPPPAPAASTAPPQTPPPPAPPPDVSTPLTPPPPPKDACGASDLQYLVGKPRTDIPVPVNPSKRRVVCSSCVMTQDFVPFRQTIIYDANTGLVTAVRCG